MSRDVEQMLRSLPLRRPSRRLNERVMRELRGGRSTQGMAGRWTGWVSGASAAAAVLALGLSIAAFMRPLPPAQVPQGRTATEPSLTTTEGRPASTEELGEEHAEQAAGRTVSEDAFNGEAFDPEPRLGSDALRQQFQPQPFEPEPGYPRPGQFRFDEPVPGGMAPVNAPNGEQSQLQ